MKIDNRLIGYVPDCLAAVLVPLLDSARVITGPPRSSPDGVWAIGGGIELPCEHVLHGAMQDRSPVRTALRQAQSEKNTNVLYTMYTATVLINPMNTITHEFGSSKMRNS